MPSEKDFGYKMETKASEAQVRQREKLYELFRNRPMPDDQLLLSLGLAPRVRHRANH